MASRPPRRGRAGGRARRSRAGPREATTGRCACADRVRWSSGCLRCRRARVGIECRPHGAHRVMKSGVDRAERDAQDLGDLLEREIGVVAQDQHGSGGRPTGVGSPSRAGPGGRWHRVRRIPTARQPAGCGGSATMRGCGGPRRSRHARGAGTTRRQSAPGRGAAADPARWRPAPAGSRPRRDRCRAGSCATRRGTSSRSRRRAARRPPDRRAGPVSRARYPRLTASAAPLRSAPSHGMGRGLGCEPSNRATDRRGRRRRRRVADGVAGVAVQSHLRRRRGSGRLVELIGPSRRHPPSSSSPILRPMTV